MRPIFIVILLVLGLTACPRSNSDSEIIASSLDQLLKDKDFRKFVDTSPSLNDYRRLLIALEIKNLDSLIQKILIDENVINKKDNIRTYSLRRVCNSFPDFIKDEINYCKNSAGEFNITQLPGRIVKIEISENDKTDSFEFTPGHMKANLKNRVIKYKKGSLEFNFPKGLSHILTENGSSSSSYEKCPGGAHHCTKEEQIEVSSTSWYFWGLCIKNDSILGDLFDQETIKFNAGASHVVVPLAHPDQAQFEFGETVLQGNETKMSIPAFKSTETNKIEILDEKNAVKCERTPQELFKGFFERNLGF